MRDNLDVGEWKALRRHEFYRASRPNCCLLLDISYMPYNHRNDAMSQMMTQIGHDHAKIVRNDKFDLDFAESTDHVR